MMTSVAPNRAPPGPKSVPRILVVEDDSMIAWDLSLSLQEAGLEVCGVAATGAAALDLARAKRPDLVVMDIHLRGQMDGIEVAKALRASGSRVPIIFVTGFGDSATARRIRTVDSAGYLLKPVLRDELVASVARALGSETQP
jgi:DNA-binding response OmpR family regulator